MLYDEASARAPISPCLGNFQKLSIESEQRVNPRVEALIGVGARLPCVWPMCDQQLLLGPCVMPGMILSTKSGVSPGHQWTCAKTQKEQMKDVWMMGKMQNAEILKRYDWCTGSMFWRCQMQPPNTQYHHAVSLSRRAGVNQSRVSKSRVSQRFFLSITLEPCVEGTEGWDWKEEGPLKTEFGEAGEGQVSD